MIRAGNFLELLNSKGQNPFIGVPCSFIKPLINYAIKSEKLEYLPVNNEGEAVAVATGAYLAGKRPVVMMQNSGLGNCVSPLTSLNYVYRIPILMIITLRGETGIKDEPQHELMGKITVDMLDIMKVKNDFFPDKEENIEKGIDAALDTMEKSGLPYSFIMRKDSVEKVETAKNEGKRLYRGKLIPCAKRGDLRLRRAGAIEIITGLLGMQTMVVSTTGKISRELFAMHDLPNQMYIVGSMGCASSIGLGLAMYQPGKRVAVLDGDGAALMRLESWVSIGHFAPSNYIHFLLDNEAYESTGGQQTLSGSVNFPEIAIACGFASAVTVYEREELEKEIKRACASPGPHIVHVKVKSGAASDLGRPNLSPVQVKERFMDFVRGNKG
ncbi:MAG: phosphonopyruvate decarboxylase [Thermodesulfobacteriota bacterium]|nr:phosphonopyruvate decarboxylase [Thermodesulfobacteriota bacterium]